jgi:ubiquinone/menaquinone biosynthesis C-methylase UbiE
MTLKNQREMQLGLKNAGCSLSLSQKEVATKRNISGYWNLRSSSYGSDVSLEELSAWRTCLTPICGDKISGDRRLKVLDVGTGRGFLAMILSEMGHQVAGLDLSSGMLGFAKAGCHEEDAPEFCLGDAERLPFQEESFDLIISRHLLWTLPHPEKAVREWKRVLKREGRIAAIDGLWFNDSPGMRLRRLLSSAITAMKERRDTRTFERHYGSIKEDLPLYSPEDPVNYRILFQEAELRSVSFQYLKEVDRAQRRRGGLLYRLANERPVFLVMGQKGV